MKIFKTIGRIMAWYVVGFIAAVVFICLSVTLFSVAAMVMGQLGLR